LLVKLDLSPSAVLTKSPQWQTLTSLGNQLHRWALDHALPLWASTGCDAPSGGFFEKIDQNGDPVALPRRGRVTPRQLYCFAVAGELGWAGPWQTILDRELATYRRQFFGPDGQVYALIGPDGRVLDEGPALYDQAFGLFALATINGLKPNRLDLESQAKTLLLSLRTRQGRPDGSFEESSPPSLPLQSNPHMHLFEACLTWASVSSDPIWAEQADAIAALCLSEFINPTTGAVHEFFDSQWQPMPGLEGRKWEPGHQFEWGWLLLQWGLTRSRPDAIAAAQLMIKVGEAYGVDKARGVAVNCLTDDLNILDGQARLWPQTERLKAGLLLAQIADNPAHLDGAIAAAKAILRYLDVQVPGLWYDRMTEDGDFIQEPAPASSFYHILCAVLELHRTIGSAA
jgi:mannose-6-phosphate isomerase